MKQIWSAECEGPYPVTLSAHSGGVFTVGLYPDEKQTGYGVSFREYQTLQVRSGFHGPGARPAEAMTRFRYPLLGKAPVKLEVR